jgi:hypothetical protein
MTVAAVLLACLAQGPNLLIESLIRDLEDDSIAVRDRAQRQLVEIGMPAVAALKKAAESAEGQAATRARMTWQFIQRAARERVHDARERAELLLQQRPKNPKLWQGRPWTAFTEEAGFFLGASKRKEGVLLYTEYHPFLFRYDEFCQRKGEVSYEVTEVVDATGLPAILERCLHCSPRRVFVQDVKGSLRITVKGRHTWFSRYELTFQDPKNGQAQEVGDMTVEVAWPLVKIRSKDGWSDTAATPNQSRFDFKLRPEARNAKPTQQIVIDGFGCGSEPPRPKPGWCECETGPVNPAGKRPNRVYSLDAKAQTGNVLLEDVENITCTIWKPHEIPFDFTVDVTPVKRD